MADLPSGHAVVDVGYLAGLVDPDKPPSDEALTAAEWRRALQYAGVLPVLRELGDGGGGGLERDLRGVSTALERLEHEEARGASLRGWVPRKGSVPPQLLLMVAAVGILLMIAQHPWLGAGALAAVAALAVAGQVGGAAAALGPSGREQVARRAMARAVRALLSQSRVEAVGPARRVVEVAPHAGELRARVHQLEDVVHQAQARARELATLIAQIRQANGALGRDPEDAETRRLAAQLDRVQAETRRVVGLRERFDASLARVEGHLEHLRLLAVRGALSARVDEVTHGDDRSAAAAAAAEVEAASLDRFARDLAHEVDDATAGLAATLETSALTRAL
jgi:hypothetical protein